MARLAAGLIRGYQLIVAPWVTVTCKYHPTCSAYAIDAVRTHGAIRGIGMAGWRLLRCNPWSQGGIDYVRPRTDPTAVKSAALRLSTEPDGALRRSAALRLSRAERT